MKLSLDSIRAKILAVSSIVVMASAMGLLVSSEKESSTKTVQKRDDIHKSALRRSDEENETHFSWLDSSVESVSLVDGEGAFDTATIGH